MSDTPPQATALFAAGCFWGVEDKFRKTLGVIDAVSGYAGGTTERPTYEEVCRGNTGHAEAVEVTYDPEKISYAELLSVFWQMHDPTTPNRQGPDIGTQYRSAIFYRTASEERLARASKAALETSHAFPRPIVTDIVSAGTFWKAEERHQRYFEKHGGAACHI